MTVCVYVCVDRDRDQMSSPNIPAAFSFPHQTSLRCTKRKGSSGHQNLHNESQEELCARELKNGLVLKDSKGPPGKITFGMCLKDRRGLIKFG